VKSKKSKTQTQKQEQFDCKRYGRSHGKKECPAYRQNAQAVAELVTSV